MGSFVKAGGLDVERIQAQISEGRVEIEGLEIDVDVSLQVIYQSFSRSRRPIAPSSCYPTGLVMEDSRT